MALISVFGYTNIEKTKVKFLKLDFCSLKNLPEEIGDFTNLQEISSQKNYLTSLPKEIGNLINLLKFNLNSNSLSSLPKEIGNLVNYKYYI